MRCTLLSLQVSLVTAIYLYFHQAISFDRLNKYALAFNGSNLLCLFDSKCFVLIFNMQRFSG